jgi:hypothetical protein
LLELLLLEIMNEAQIDRRRGTQRRGLVIGYAEENVSDETYFINKYTM